MGFLDHVVMAGLMAEGVVREHPADGGMMSRIELVGDRLGHGSTPVEYRATIARAAVGS
jgi:hypothetical protein